MIAEPEGAAYREPAAGPRTQTLDVLPRPAGLREAEPAQGTRVERQALCAKRRGCRTGKLTAAANAQDGILSLRTVRAGALADMMPLRNATPETVPGRMRAVATKLADWHRPQGAHAALGLPLPTFAAGAQVRPGMAAKQRRSRGARGCIGVCY